MPVSKDAAATAASESTAENVAPVLARSARAASILISLQIGSRLLTFSVNQLLVRFLSPKLLGTSAKLELFSISVLTFSRESIRIALGRQGKAPPKENGASNKEKGSKVAEAWAPSRRAQEDVNLSYVAVALGPVFAMLFSWWFFWRKLDPALAAMPYFNTCSYISAAATMLELCMEPCFAITAQQTLLGLRARAETSAAIARAVVSCGLTIISSRNELSLGALPFALGQLSFALTINAVYYYDMIRRARAEGFSLTPKWIQTDASRYIMSYFPRGSSQVARNLYAQSGLKFLLTQGDSYLIAEFSGINTQGIYALASNYGALLARMVFQPIEESSRGVLAGLLSKHVDNAPSNSEEKSGAKPNVKDANLLSARTYLLTILRFYGLLSAGLAALLPAFAPILLSIVAGSRWTQTEAPAVLGLYGYYLPLLAFNGILEAFVAATATPAQLRTQNMAMIGFTVGFVSVAFLILRIGDGGAKGVVAANAANMAMRIMWSYRYVSGWFAERGVGFGVTDFLPRGAVMAAGVAVASMLQWISANGDGSLANFLQIVGVGAAYGLLLLHSERKFLVEGYRMFRPSRTAPSKAGEHKHKD